jgi:vitamin B12 transporter
LRSGIDGRFIHVDSTEDGLRSGGNGGLYITAEWNARADFMLIGSVKGATDFRNAGESDAVRTGLVAVPKIGFLWKVSDKVTLKNNYFRGFKFPDFDDLYYHDASGLYRGNPHLLPEDGVGADIGADFASGGLLALSGTGYAQYTTDSIHWVKSGVRWQPENIGRACFIGADVRPSVSLTPDNDGDNSDNSGGKDGGYAALNLGGGTHGIPDASNGADIEWYAALAAGFLTGGAATALGLSLRRKRSRAEEE